MKHATNGGIQMLTGTLIQAGEIALEDGEIVTGILIQMTVEDLCHADEIPLYREVTIARKDETE